MKKIYAEWKINGVFENGFFWSNEEFNNFTFSPEIEVLMIKEWRA